MNCVPFGFWFEAGRALFGLVVVVACAVPVVMFYAWLLWATRRKRR